MKKSIVTLLFTLIGDVAFTSCKDKSAELPKTDANTSTSSFSCLIDGVRFSPDFVLGQVSEQTQNILITAQKNDREIVRLFIPVSAKTGTQTLGNPLGDVFVQAYYGVDEDRFGFAILPTDKLTISSHNKATTNITGSFAFESEIDGEETFLKTEGSFDVNYQQPTLQQRRQFLRQVCSQH